MTLEPFAFSLRIGMPADRRELRGDGRDERAAGGTCGLEFKGPEASSLPFARKSPRPPIPSSPTETSNLQLFLRCP